MEKIFKYYIVYQTVNTVNKKIYIGVHQTATLEFDGYIGCGVRINNSNTYSHPKTHFLKAVKKYGPTAFIRTTLKVFDNELDALDLERWLVDESFLKRPDTYNMVLGGGKLSKPDAKKVFIYDKQGNFVKEVESRTDAAKFIFGDAKYVKGINTAIEHGYFCKEYQVSNIKVPFMKDFETHKLEKLLKIAETINKKYDSGKVLNFTNPKKVALYTLKGELVKIWESLNQCRKSGFTNVLAVVEGKRNLCKGFIFKYYED